VDFTIWDILTLWGLEKIEFIVAESGLSGFSSVGTFKEGGGPGCIKGRGGDKGFPIFNIRGG